KASLPFQPAFTGLSEQIAIHGHFRAHETALLEGTRHVSWHEYNQRANRIARALITMGVRPGVSVATMLVNGIWAHELLLAIWQAGAAMVPLSPLLSDANLATMVADCDPALMFASDDWYGKCSHAGQPRRTFN